VADPTTLYMLGNNTAAIVFTTDGAHPTCESQRYEGHSVIFEKTSLVKAGVCRFAKGEDGAMMSHNIAQASFTYTYTAPYTLHPTPHTSHPTLYTLHPTPYTLHPTPYTKTYTTPI
jgi:hypothetical protein